MGNLFYKSNSFEDSLIDIEESKGIVRGHAASLGTKDSDNETIVPNAFKRTLKSWKEQVASTGNGRIKVLRDHDLTKLIGKPLELYEKDNALEYVNQLSLKTRLARDTFTLIQDQVITEHSIGYNVIDYKTDDNDKSHKFLTELKLWEISYVTFGANQWTPVLEAKSKEDFDQFIKYINRIKKSLKNRAWETDEVPMHFELFLEQVEEHLDSVTKSVHQEIQKKSEDISTSTDLDEETTKDTGSNQEVHPVKLDSYFNDILEKNFNQPEIEDPVKKAFDSIFEKALKNLGE